MKLEEAIEILKEFKNTGYHTLMAKYNWDRIKANTMIEIAIETVLNHLTKQEKMIESAKDRIEYYLMGNSKLDDFYEREKELEKLLNILNKAKESE